MIKFLVMDVDGTLTDGKIYMGNDGEICKVFDIKDGCGIKDILPKQGIIPIIITARSSKIVKNRCDELGISMCYQGVKDKYSKLVEIISDYNRDYSRNYTLKNCAYIGDDIVDLLCMHEVKKNDGIIGCPCNATKEVIDISDFVSRYRGGDGAVREFIEWIVKSVNNY